MSVDPGIRLQVQSGGSLIMKEDEYRNWVRLDRALFPYCRDVFDVPTLRTPILPAGAVPGPWLCVMVWSGPASRLIGMLWRGHTRLAIPVGDNECNPLYIDPESVLSFRSCWEQEARHAGAVGNPTFPRPRPWSVLEVARNGATRDIFTQVSVETLKDFLEHRGRVAQVMDRWEVVDYLLPENGLEHDWKGDRPPASSICGMGGLASAKDTP